MATTHAQPIADCGRQRPAMEKMLRYLPAQHREIIIATYFRRRTIGEAAELLGLAPKTAEARLYQAVRDLSLMVTVARSEHATSGARPGRPAPHRRR